MAAVSWTTFLNLLYVFEPQWLPSMKWPFWGDSLEFETLENIAFVKIHLPVSIRQLFKKVNGIRKSDDSPPPVLKPSWDPPHFPLYQWTFFWKKSIIFVSLDRGPAKSTPDRQSGTWRVSEPEEYQHFRFSCFWPLEVNVLRSHVPLIIHLAKSGLRGSEWA